MTSHTAPLTPAQAETLRKVLDYDFENKPYALFSARKGKLNVTVDSSSNNARRANPTPPSPR